MGEPIWENGRIPPPQIEGRKIIFAKHRMATKWANPTGGEMGEALYKIRGNTSVQMGDDICKMGGTAR